MFNLKYIVFLLGVVFLCDVSAELGEMLIVFIFKDEFRLLNNKATERKQNLKFLILFHISFTSGND